MQIHPTAIIADGAEIGFNVEIGPYSIIGPNVKIGSNTKVKSHVVIEGKTIIGHDNIIFQFASIGADPQDLKFSGEDSEVIIGNNNTIREFVTIHKGTKDDAMKTKIGSNCLLMAYVHVAHDCIIEDGAILANAVTLAGHVKVGSGAVIGGLAAIHQFVRIGQGAMIGGLSGVENDVIPYGTVIGERAKLAGLNLVGLKRKKLERSEISQIRKFYKDLFESGKEENFMDRVSSIRQEYHDSSLVCDVIDFILTKNSRAICQPSYAKIHL